MASKSAQGDADKVDVEELLDIVDKTMDRLKVLYEQYFLGLQKQPPSHIHNDVERRLRDLMQVQIRNTGLRYRFATLQQKFGSYNTYWRRTLRQIENGTYIRNLSKISRRAAQTGEEIPEEILAAMPKRMREQVKRDREVALAAARRREGTVDDSVGFDDEVATGPSALASALDRRTRDGAHILSEDDADLDLDAFFAAMTDEADAPADTRPQGPARRGRSDRASTMTDDLGDETRDEIAALPHRPAAPAPHVAATLGMPPTRRSSPSIPVAGGVRRTGPIPTVQPHDLDPPTERGVMPGARTTAHVPTFPDREHARTTAHVPTFPENEHARTTASVPTFPTSRTTGPIPAPRPGTPPPPPTDPARTTGSLPRMATPPPAPRAPSAPPTAAQSGPSQRQRPDTFAHDDDTNPDAFAFAAAGRTPGPQPVARPPTGSSRPGTPAPSQAARPIPVAPGASQNRPSTPVESMSGPFPRAAPPPVAPRQSAPQVQPRPQPAPMRPPPGMNDADVNALYAKYVQAKKAVGEDAGPGAYGKLMQTINAQAPKIMEQYKAKGVEFSVVVKDNQVVIKAKPKP